MLHRTHIGEEDHLISYNLVIRTFICWDFCGNVWRPQPSNAELLTNSWRKWSAIGLLWGKKRLILNDRLEDLKQLHTCGKFQSKSWWTIIARYPWIHFSKKWANNKITSCHRCTCIVPNFRSQSCFGRVLWSLEHAVCKFIPVPVSVTSETWNVNILTFLALFMSVFSSLKSSFLYKFMTNTCSGRLNKSKYLKYHYNMP